MKRARLSLPMFAALIFTLTSAPIVGAQDYPVRTVTIIVTFAVSGTINSVARVVAPKLEHVPPQLNQGDSRGAEDGRGYRH